MDDMNKKTNKAGKVLIIAFVFIMVFIVKALINGDTFSSRNFNILSNSDNKDYMDELIKYGKKEGMNIKVTYADDLEAIDLIEDTNDFEKNKQWFDKYIAPNMNIVKQETRNVWGHQYEFYFFADGGVMGLFNTNLRDFKFFPISLDKCLNSSHWNAPAEGRCVFSFYYNPPSRYNFEPFDHALELESNIEYSLKYHRNYGCYNKEYSNSTWPAYCTKIIQYNGWKIPKDYPYRLY